MRTHSRWRDNNILPKHLFDRRPDQLEALRIRRRNRRRLQSRCTLGTADDIQGDTFTVCFVRHRGTVARGALVESDVCKAELVRQGSEQAVGVLLGFLDG